MSCKTQDEGLISQKDFDGVIKYLKDAPTPEERRKVLKATKVQKPLLDPLQTHAFGLHLDDVARKAKEYYSHCDKNGKIDQREWRVKIARRKYELALAALRDEYSTEKLEVARKRARFVGSLQAEFERFET